MSVLYTIIDFLLPFEFMSHNFMKNALIGILLVSPLLGILGTMTVNNKMSFFSDALGHSALTGIAIGVLFGINNPIGTMIAFSLLMTLAIIKVKSANTASTDTIIGVFSSSAVALGIVILSSRGGFNKYATYLIGDLLSIRPIDLLILAIVFAIIIVLWFVVFNPLLLVSLNPSLARSRGINVQLYEYIFTFTLAIVVTISIQWVGILIISSMLVLPAAAARNIAKNMRQYHAFSILIGLCSGILGLVISYFAGTATGATIVLVSSIFYGLTLLGHRFMMK